MKSLALVSGCALALIALGCAAEPVAGPGGSAVATTPPEQINFKLASGTPAPNVAFHRLALVEVDYTDKPVGRPGPRDVRPAEDPDRPVVLLMGSFT